MPVLLTSKQIILDLINNSNFTDIQLNQVDLGEPTNDSETKDTTLPVNAVVRQGFTGSVNIQYNKVNMALLHNLTNLDFTVTEPELTTQMILDVINDRLGIELLLHVDVVEGIVNTLNDEVRPITIYAASSSKVWKGSITLSVTAPQFEVYGNIQTYTLADQTAVYGETVKSLAAGAIGNEIHIFEIKNNNHWVYNMDTNTITIKQQHPLWTPSNPSPGGGTTSEYNKKVACVSYDKTKIIIREATRFTLYDPATNTFEHFASTSTSLNNASNARATILVDTPYGLYSIGGTTNQGSAIDGTHRAKITFDSGTHTYSSTAIGFAALPNPPGDMGFTSGVYLNNKIYVYGSAVSTGQQGVDRMMIYDILANTWSTEVMPVGGDSFYSIALGGKIVVVGGRNGAARLNTELSPTLNLILIYDPTDGSYVYEQSETVIPMGGGFGYYNGSLWLVKGVTTEGYDFNGTVIPYLDVMRIT